MDQEIKHQRFYVDLNNMEEVQEALAYFEDLAGQFSFPMYATLQSIRLANSEPGIRTGVAHATEQATNLFPTCWVVAVENNLVPQGYTDTDQITVNQRVDWMVRDLNPGLLGDYNQQDLALTS